MLIITFHLSGSHTKYIKKVIQSFHNMGLKHWILPKDNFKTHLFFSIFGWGDPSQLGSWSEGCVKPLKLSREAI